MGGDSVRSYPGCDS